MKTASVIKREKISFKLAASPSVVY